LSLAGFGLALRAVEARHGQLSLRSFHGLYENTPILAVFFLLTGLASVGFPGTFAFLGTELLVDGVVQTYPLVGIAVVAAASLNGIAVVQAYFRLFTGKRHLTSVYQRSPWRERIAILALTLLLVGGGVYPQPGVASRHHAAMAILAEREGTAPSAGSPQDSATPRRATRFMTKTYASLQSRQPAGEKR
jgi:NADH-quinone oxidoreductase subunit M